MAMSVGAGSGVRAQNNMTPMIDVLLVLIIIFMVIMPVKSVGLHAQVPQTAAPDAAPQPPANDVVATVHRDGTVSLNQEPPLAINALGDRLRGLFARNPSHVIFVRGEKDLEFQQIAVVIDIARGVGMDHVALMTF